MAAPESSWFAGLLESTLRRVGLWGLYVKYSRIVNYGFVCGVVGVAVNYAVYHLLLLAMWEPVAFYAGVGVAALSNYTFTVGRGGHLFGLARDADE